MAFGLAKGSLGVWLWKPQHPRNRVAGDRAASRPLGVKVDSGLLAAAGFLVAALGLAWWLTFVVRLHGVEAMGRAVDVWMLFVATDWRTVPFNLLLPPLPSLLQIPLALVPGLDVHGFSGNIVSALSGSTAIWALDRCLRRLELSRVLRAGLLASFALNPLVLLYAANGASEMLFVALLVLSIDQGLAIVEPRTREWPVDFGPAIARADATDVQIQRIVLLGILGGLALLTRYAALLFVPLWLMLIVWHAGRDRTGAPRLQAVATLYLLPVVFFVGLLGLASALITGDPLFPVTHMSETALRQGVADPALAKAASSALRETGSTEILGSLAEQLFLVQPVFTLMFAALLFASWKGDRRAILLAGAGGLLIAAVVISIPARRQILLRDLLLAVPLAVLFLGWLTARWKGTASRVLALVLAASAPVVCGAGMLRADEAGEWPQEFLSGMLARSVGTLLPDAFATVKPELVWRSEQAIADRVVKDAGWRDVLVDDVVGYRLIFLSGRPDRFLTRADPDFDLVVGAPVGKVGYILVPTPGPAADLDQISRRYPGLFSYGADWAQLVADWPEVGWRLFSVPSRNP